jgi:hypothetical protein
VDVRADSVRCSRWEQVAQCAYFASTSRARSSCRLGEPRRSTPRAAPASSAETRRETPSLISDRSYNRSGSHRKRSLVHASSGSCVASPVCTSCSQTSFSPILFAVLACAPWRLASAAPVPRRRSPTARTRSIRQVQGRAQESRGRVAPSANRLGPRDVPWARRGPRSATAGHGDDARSVSYAAAVVGQSSRALGRPDAFGQATCRYVRVNSRLNAGWPSRNARGQRRAAAVASSESKNANASSR